MNKESNMVDGFRIPDGIDPVHVKGIADKLTDVAELARRADKVIQGKRQTVADQMLSIARECADVKEFNAAIYLATAKYQARHGKKGPMPKVYTQTASDIRRMYAEGVDLSTRDPGTKEFLTYSALKKAVNKSRAAQQAKLREAIEATTPEYIKELRRLFSNLESLAKTKDSDTYKTSVPIIEEIVAIGSDLYAKHLSEHPEDVAKPDMAEEEEELSIPDRRQSEQREQATG